MRHVRNCSIICLAAVLASCNPSDDQPGLWINATAAELMRLEPNLTVSKWLARSPSAPYAIGQEWADVLRKVGIPD